jgi:hypothetical protein
MPGASLSIEPAAGSTRKASPAMAPWMLPVASAAAPPLPRTLSMPPASPAADRTRERETVYLVACGKAKRRCPSKARDLYTGNLFRACRAHAEAHGSLWRILSGLHGVLDPERCIEPYDAEVPRRERDVSRWATEAAAALTSDRALRGRFRIVCLAGEDYAAPLRPELERRGVQISCPLRGLAVGQRLRWLKQHTHGFAGARLEVPLDSEYSPTSMDQSVRYTTHGPLRGKCGHRHKNLDGAIDCLDEDEALCVSRGGHTDRQIFAIGPGGRRSLNDDELAAMAAYRAALKR